MAQYAVRGRIALDSIISAHGANVAAPLGNTLDLVPVTSRRTACAHTKVRETPVLPLDDTKGKSPRVGGVCRGRSRTKSPQGGSINVCLRLPQRTTFALPIDRRSRSQVIFVNECFDHRNQQPPQEKSIRHNVTSSENQGDVNLTSGGSVHEKIL
jgi:hypothetical protein